MTNERKKILVALSGGVDSAVAAARLLKQGHEVVGVFFRFFGADTVNTQVKKIAKKLGIPLKIVDARKEFKKSVIDYFLNAYKTGTTPNPCVVCNKEMKFRLMFELMKKFDADYVATGHYARLGRKIPNPKSQIPNKSKLLITNYKLLAANDKSKDQSYFLYRLAQKDLAKIVFPLGDYEKTEVKRMAKKLKLPVSKDESQDICFLGGKPISEFLKKRVKWVKGEIMDIKGNKLGVHKGLPFYTLGQRKGIEIGGAGPYFVIGKNVRKNELIVSNDEKKLLTKKFIINKANWVDREIKFPLEAQVQTRYHAEKFSATIKKGKNSEYTVETKKPLRAVTPGQSAVFYRKGEALGGGIIL